MWLLSRDRERESKENEGEICEGYLYQISQGITGGPLRAQAPPGSEHFRTEATFKHGHYVESADIVTACYQSLASWSFDPGVGGVEGGGVIAHLTESPD